MWIFNSLLTKDKNYKKLIIDSLDIWKEEYFDKSNYNGLWDYIKYNIRKTTIKYSKTKQKIRRVLKQKLTDEMKQIEIKLELLISI